MEMLICNKCFIPIYKGKLPYIITQCGHIFCQDCLQQVKKQCFQCKYNDPAYLPLEEPLMPKKISLFTPSSEILEMLLKKEISESNQLKITMERFHTLDNKYEMLKRHYVLLRRNMKILLEKYMYLKAETEKKQKQLLQMTQSTSKSISNTTRTLTNSDLVSTYSLNTRYSSGSLNHLKFFNLNLSDATNMSIRSANLRKQHKIDDSFSTSDNNTSPTFTKLLFIPDNRNDSN
ncbi:zip homologous protein 2-like isoform X2 [Cataglyphis hispanica]|nr:zip homologous protein 2-like isoform X2 [Cataglyphis hispanica]XP_050457849.1 zip homologous protein 2-like isoform X2 [Cataglyphis hispanica]